MLHYHDNNQPLEKGRLLLLDFGLRYGDVVSDISRTVPVNGVFNPLQRMVYEIVLKSQAYIESLVKPGVSMDTLNTACWTYLHEQLDKTLAAHDGTCKRDYTDRPHQMGHLIKTVVHDGDPWRSYAKRPLRVGECISNEPGFYGYVEAVIDGTPYKETMGIRIEDNLLVTETGCQNLSKDIPKSCADIEACMT